MSKKSPKIYTMMILTTLVLSMFSIVVPAAFADTITGRPTVYLGNNPGDPLNVAAGAYVNITLANMTISGAQIWLWLSTYGGADINTALGDRWYAGPFYMGDVSGSTTRTYSVPPPEPFAQEGRTYQFVVGNNWINGTIPFMVQGGVDYWIKIADVSPRESIASSEVGVSTNRIRFLESYFATPLEGAPDTEVTVSGAATAVGTLYNITQDNTLVYGLVPSQLNVKDGWNWTGFSRSFKVKDLKGRVTQAGPEYGNVPIKVIENESQSTVATFLFTQYFRKVYVPDPNFRAHGGTYTSVTLETGKEYNVTLQWFPAFGSASIYLNATFVAGPIALNGTGGVHNYTITIPDLATGNYLFRVIDNHAVEYNFLIHVKMVPYILVDPTSGYVGNPFTVIGRNFMDYIGQRVTIWFYHFGVSPGTDRLLLANFTVTATSWSLPLTVPHSAGGERTVEAANITGTYTIDTTTFTVLPKVEVVPSEFKNDGSLVRAMGTGLDAGGAYTPNIDNQYLGANNDGVWTTAAWSNETGDIIVAFVAAGFRPGLHVFSLYPEKYGPPYVPIYATFTVTVEDDLTVKTILGQLDAVNATVTGISEKIDGYYLSLNTTLGEIEVKIDSINATLAGLITTANGEVLAKIDTSLGNLTAKLDALDAKIANVSGNVVTISTKIGELKTDLDALGVNITKIGKDTVTIKTAVGTLDGKITKIDGNTVTIMTKVGTIETDTSKIKTDVANVPPAISGVTTAVWIAVVLSLIAAIAACYSVITIRRKIAG